MGMGKKYVVNGNFVVSDIMMHSSKTAVEVNVTVPGFVS